MTGGLHGTLSNLLGELYSAELRHVHNYIGIWAVFPS